MTPREEEIRIESHPLFSMVDFAANKEEEGSSDRHGHAWRELNRMSADVSISEQRREEIKRVREMVLDSMNEREGRRLGQALVSIVFG